MGPKTEMYCLWSDRYVMGVFHRALFTWFCFQIFLILLTLKLEDKISWNWFIIFIPMWLLDSNILIFILFKLIQDCKSRIRGDSSIQLKCWYLFCVMLKVTFEAGICVKLDYVPNLRLFYIAIPAWILLIGVFIELTKNLVKFYRYVIDTDRVKTVI